MSSPHFLYLDHKSNCNRDFKKDLYVSKKGILSLKLSSSTFILSFSFSDENLVIMFPGVECYTQTHTNLKERDDAVASDGLQQPGGASEALECRPTAGEKGANHNDPR